MPAWVTVYCFEPIGEMPDSETLSKEIRNNDYWTLAEDYDIDESLVDVALANFRIENDGSGFSLHYGQQDARPLTVHYWTNQDRVVEEVQEVVERLGDDTRSQTIKGHLKNAKAVVGIEMGFTQLEDMGIVFAYEVARWFGRHRGGLIKDDDDNWSVVDSHGGFDHM